jgi:hypothetical protein
MAVHRARTREERSRFVAQFQADASQMMSPLKPDQDAQDGHRLQRLDSIDAHEALTGIECFGSGSKILRMMVNLNPVVTDISEFYN